MHEGMLMLCIIQMHFIDMRARTIISSYLQGIEHHGSFTVITMVPHACIQEGDADLPNSRDKMMKQMQCMSDDTIRVHMREGTWSIV